MAKTKEELAKQLDNIETKLTLLKESFAAIKRNVRVIKKQVYAKRDSKEILKLKNKIASL